MQYGCIAERLGHSFSPEIHALLADYSYELCELAPHEVGLFLKSGDFCGINVTIPYKETVIPYLSFVDEEAKRIGAVNTIVRREGKLYGYNTDFYGMCALFEHMGVSLAGRKVAILGTGGTSRTSRAVAEALGASEILLVSRRARDGVITYEDLYQQHSDIEILINTTPVGMYPHPDAAAVDVRSFPHLKGVADAVYNPVRSTLVLEARQLGIPAEGGLFMLIAQAMRASEIFLDKTYPKGTVERIYEILLRRKENLVLIGMPGSGKSTVGRLLASSLGRELVDTDELVVRADGREISAIFREDGEVFFRDLETRMICEGVAQRNGLVVATGGGAILREENVAALRRNGRLYFLDRELRDLLPTPDRPLASSAEDIRRRYEERYDLYIAAADRRIGISGDAEQTAREIGKDFETL